MRSTPPLSPPPIPSLHWPGKTAASTLPVIRTCPRERARRTLSQPIPDTTSIMFRWTGNPWAPLYPTPSPTSTAAIRWTSRSLKIRRWKSGLKPKTVICSGRWRLPATRTPVPEDSCGLPRELVSPAHCRKIQATPNIVSRFLKPGAMSSGAAKCPTIPPAIHSLCRWTVRMKWSGIPSMAVRTSGYGTS